MPSDDQLERVHGMLKTIDTFREKGATDAQILRGMLQYRDWFINSESAFITVNGLLMLLGLMTGQEDLRAEHYDKALLLLTIAVGKFGAALRETADCKPLFPPLVRIAQRLDSEPLMDQLYATLEAFNQEATPNNDAVLLAAAPVLVPDPDLDPYMFIDEEADTFPVKTAWERPAPATMVLPQLPPTIHPPQLLGFTLTDGTTLTFGSSASRYRKNIDAIALLRALQIDERKPGDVTAAERLMLAHYSAFGESALLTRAIEKDPVFAKLVNEEEQRRISRAALTAFYTPPEMAATIWNAIAPSMRMLPGNRTMLESSMGIGVFIATMPLDLRERTAITGVELDTVSSDIAKYLHPDVYVMGSTSFEQAQLPESNYDLVIGNVPFSAHKVFYLGFKEDYLKRCLHDFFIARSIQLVRPGGIVCVLTSYGTMDKSDPKARLWIDQRAELISAIRLPQGAFEISSGTMCGADLLIFRRREEVRV